MTHTFRTYILVFYILARNFLSNSLLCNLNQVYCANSKFWHSSKIHSTRWLSKALDKKSIKIRILSGAIPFNTSHYYLIHSRVMPIQKTECHLTFAHHWPKFALMRINPETTTDLQMYYIKKDVFIIIKVNVVANI